MNGFLMRPRPDSLPEVPDGLDFGKAFTIVERFGLER
jgi:hypothetical protein